MVVKMDVDALRAKLPKYDQEHLLQHWENLSDAEKKKLYDEITALDMDELMADFERTIATLNETSEKLDDKMQPLAESQCGSVLKASDEEKKDFEMRSFEAIAAGHMAILLLAGGQGTRLGVSYPKGMYKVGLPSEKSLFQLQAERIMKLEQLAEKATRKKGGKIAWYIMTSASTVKPTSDFFVENNYFGLEAKNVIVFQQGTLPCFTFDGKIIMSSKYEMSRAPDGNGGLYRALRVDGILDDMEKRGVKYVQLYCVDNILVRVGDPVFTGYCISKGSECANKVVPKGFPTEAVGITCKVDGKYQVVEYSEITEQSAELRNEDGSLTYSAANICIHFFTFEFLKRVCNQHERELIHHVAKKKIPSVGADGVLVKPDKPNGIKMEKFVFDVFRFANNFVIWECVREDEFAPLKNANGASDFTPNHCRNALYALHQKYLINAGAKMADAEGNRVAQMVSPAAVKENNNNNNNEKKSQELVVVCELAPSLTYAGEGLAELVGGKQITVPADGGNVPLPPSISQ